MGFVVIGIDGKGHQALFAELPSQLREPIGQMLHEGAMIADEGDEDGWRFTSIGETVLLTIGIRQTEIRTGGAEVDHGRGDAGHEWGPWDSNGTTFDVDGGLLSRGLSGGEGLYGLGPVGLQIRRSLQNQCDFIDRGGT